MINHLSLQKFVLASVCWLALASAQAQTADGTVVISGQLSANTCKLLLKDASGNGNNGVRTVGLGTINPPAGTITPGTLLGTQQTISFSLTNSNGSGTCTFASGTSGWNLVFDMQTGQVGTAASKAFLTNQASSNAAGNVGVTLFSQQGIQFSSIATGAGYLGTKLANGIGGADFNATLTLGAQFMATSTSAPTAGVFIATVPLLIVYN